MRRSTRIATVATGPSRGYHLGPRVVGIYQVDVLLLQPCGQPGAVGERLEQRGSEGAVVIAPHSPHADKPLGHLLVALQQRDVTTSL